MNKYNKISNPSNIRVCYLPGREVSYSRTRVFLKGLEENDVSVLDCSNSSKSSFRYIKSFGKFIRWKGKSDVILVGFFGYFLVPLVRLFTRKKIVFDAFVSVYQTMVFDRRTFRSGGILARMARMIDRAACHKADKILLDTKQHIEYFKKEYNLPGSKFVRLSASADDSIMYPRPEILSPEFCVHFHGEFQSLHGTECIIKAALLLPDIKFQIVGKGREFTASRDKSRKEGQINVKFYEPVSYEELAIMMARATVCLGIFGDTQKAGLVIPHKVYEALAMGKPVITADTPAARELLEHGKTALLCPQADPQALAASITKLHADENLRKSLAENGRKLFMEQCRPSVLGRQMAVLFSDICGNSD